MFVCERVREREERTQVCSMGQETEKLKDVESLSQLLRSRFTSICNSIYRHIKLRFISNSCLPIQYGRNYGRERKGKESVCW